MSVRRRFGAGRAPALAFRLAVLGAASMAAPGCLDRPIAPIDAHPTSGVSERLAQGTVDKIDLLLAIDNSKSMADKQAILALAVPDLVRGLLLPLCVDAAGVPAATQPDGPVAPCPPGTEREFEPVLDVHIGIISSSLGGHGGSYCPDVVKQSADVCAPSDQTSNNDKGHLLSRVDPYSDATVPTYEDRGYLAWDPGEKLDPPGESKLDDSGSGLVPSIADMVKGVGQQGCGYEAQLESWYRFLVDPEPYGRVTAEDGHVVRTGVDATLIKQREEFLRPDSLVAIVMLTDENDCSVKERSFFYRATDSHPLPRPRHECAADPNDPCCRSCGEDQGECPYDPTCYDANGDIALLDPTTEDQYSLRCFDQKRRFGVDFLYPVERYVNALSKTWIDPSKDTLEVTDGEGVENPLFADPDPTDSVDVHRDPRLVYFAGIVGVPWQDIARDPSDLTRGLKSAAELGEPDAAGHTAWDVILGDPRSGTAPLDPLMRESVDARKGESPVVGEPLAQPDEPLGNSINGNERTITGKDDLQFACVFPLLPGTERHCDAECSTHDGCDCKSPTNDSPLCEAEPGTGARTLQARAKAYPGLRQLSVLKGLGDQGIVGSVCPAQLTDPGTTSRREDFGYRPAIGAIVERLKSRLGSQCLPRTLTPDEEDQVSCLIIEARHEDGECTCDLAEARLPVQPEHEQALTLPRADEATSGRGCFCEVPQLRGKALEVCQSEAGVGLQADGAPVDGWCYVDATTVPPTGNPDLISPSCSPAERRMIRFVGKGKGRNGSVQYISCVDG